MNTGNSHIGAVGKSEKPFFIAFYVGKKDPLRPHFSLAIRSEGAIIIAGTALFFIALLLLFPLTPRRRPRRPRRPCRRRCPFTGTATATAAEDDRFYPFYPEDPEPLNR